MRGKERYFDLVFWGGVLKGFMGSFHENFPVEPSCLHCHTASLKEMKSQLTQTKERHGPY